MDESVFDKTEKTAFALRELYISYGYLPYKMSKFEEYDLYGKNKDFLVSDAVITFTDTGGRLMALKPDVTLSIIKNGRDVEGQLEKVCYNENVYRVSGGTGSFKEIPQAGLECIGALDGYCMGEVLLLAAKSLALCAQNYALVVSHLGILSAVLDGICTGGELRASILKCVSQKNLHGISELCASFGVPDEKAEDLKTLLAAYGRPEKVFPALEKLSEKYEIQKEIDELKSAVSVFGDGEKDAVTLDFSTVADPNYYNGIIFNGYVEGLPQSILSGGRYDRLMRKMGRKANAAGFAVYLDMLDFLPDEKTEYDIDVLLLYGETEKPSDVQKTVAALTANGKRVLAAKEEQKKYRYKQLAKLKDGEVTFLEENA